MIASIVVALAVAAQTPVPQAKAPPGAPTAQAAENEDSAQIDKAFAFIQAKQPAQGIEVLNGVIARNEARYRGEKRVIYSSRSMAETVYYGGLAAAAKTDAVVIDENWSLALFLKGYALIDLGRPDDAKPLFDKAIAMAPMNSHYLGERAEWYKSRKDWTTSYSEFERAAAAAEMSPDDMKSFDTRRAWRGMAYARVEQGRLDEAEALLRRALAMDSSDENAQHELDYIKSVRAKAN